MELGRVGRKCKGHWVNGVGEEKKKRRKKPNTAIQENQQNHTRWRGRKEEKESSTKPKP